MIHLWTFLAISILAVSGYIGQVMGLFLRFLLLREWLSLPR